MCAASWENVDNHIMAKYKITREHVSNAQKCGKKGQHTEITEIHNIIMIYIH